jgi:hypothetical protein
MQKPHGNPLHHLHTNRSPDPLTHSETAKNEQETDRERRERERTRDRRQEMGDGQKETTWYTDTERLREKQGRQG